MAVNCHVKKFYNVCTRWQQDMFCYLHLVKSRTIVINLATTEAKETISRDLEYFKFRKNKIFMKKFKKFKNYFKNVAPISSDNQGTKVNTGRIIPIV